MFDYSTLNTEQLKAVTSDHPRKLVIAGAGSGKTYSLTANLSYLVEHQVDPSSILVLTFTNAAAFEMKERYERYNPGQRTPEFRTFHAFCYHILGSDLRIREIVGYSATPSIIDDEQLKRYTQQAKELSGCKLSDSKLKHKDLTYSENLSKQAYEKTLTKLLRKDNVITFKLLCDKICALFIDHDVSTQKYIDRYKYIMVDEFQDTDDEQWQFVNSFPNAKVMVIGDPLQALYGFRGATSKIIKSLADDPSWEKHILFKNYRSTKAICKFANEMSTYADDTYRVPLSGVSDRAGTIQVLRNAYTRFGQTLSSDIRDDVIEYIKLWTGTTAILARTNQEVAEISDFLSDSGVVHSTSNKNSDSIHILKSLKSSEHMVDWLSSMLTAEKYANFTKICLLNEGQSTPLQILMEQFSNFKITSAMNSIQAIREVFKSNLTREQKVSKILSILNLPKDIPIDLLVSNAKEFIDSLITAIEEYKSSELYVGTIHSSKGLEYDNVILVNVDTKLFPLNTEDNLNLYYVGITRAKTNLLVEKG